MTTLQKRQRSLAKHLEKVQKTPAGFELFIAIHDFVEEVEAHPGLPKLALPSKYSQLKQVHQGLKDTKGHSDSDLGHERYMVIQDLIRIKKKEVSDSNPIWKKRELFRSLSAEVYAVLSASVAE